MPRWHLPKTTAPAGPVTEARILQVSGRRSLGAGGADPWPLSGAATSAPPLPGDPARGRQLFLQHGAACHGVNLEGGVGPRLNPVAKLPLVSDPVDPDYLIGAISNGLPGGMPAWKQHGPSSG